MEKLQGWLKLFHPIKSIIKLALGREIRYVEYKLRRQKQEKKKMKQAQKDFTYGTNSMYEPNNGGGRTTTVSISGNYSQWERINLGGGVEFRGSAGIR